MLYYLGKGTEFKKEDCKEYKTIEGVTKAAAKDENFVVWDETGAVIDTTKNPEDDAEAEFAKAGEEQDAEKETGDAEGVQDETDEEKVENKSPETEESENEENTASEDETDEEGKIIVPQGTMIVTVICDGTLNLRRSASWGNDNICGRAARGQSYYVKEIHTVAGKKMVRTIDDIYLSGQSEHVQFEQL
jgi:hypothetical protein